MEPVERGLRVLVGVGLTVPNVVRRPRLDERVSEIAAVARVSEDLCGRVDQITQSTVRVPEEDLTVETPLVPRLEQFGVSGCIRRSFHKVPRETLPFSGWYAVRPNRSNVSFD